MNLRTVSFLLAIILSSCQTDDLEIRYVLEGTHRDQISYGLDELTEILSSQHVSLTETEDPNQAHLQIRVAEGETDEVHDGYSLIKESDELFLSANAHRGAQYGLLDIAEQLSQGSTWSELNNKTITPHYPLRGIKFNLPWFSYRSGKNLSLHEETCKDLRFWESFLNMMVENRFNTLTLWNLHPYMYMVQPISFPDATPFTPEELAGWKSFWKALFRMAKDRGIDTYIFNWNIFVSEEFSKAYQVAAYSKSSGFLGEGETNEVIEKYTREMVTQTINEYEDLTGIGITLGERMGGMTSEERKNWIDRTIIAGLKEADREARLFYRAPLSAGTHSGGSTSISTERITRKAIEEIGLNQDVWLGFKFNWSHAHSSPKLSIVHGGMLTDTYWNPPPTNYKGIWTMRNEDFIALRWAQPDFVRDFLSYNSQPYVGGCLIGSETYIPAKDYITREEHRTWDYAFERQWLFYKVWGNLLYHADTPDSYFANTLSKKFNISQGDRLLLAWKLASANAHRMASFYQGTWDATLYTEGFTTIGGKFIDIDAFINQPVLDSNYVNIQDFVNGTYPHGKILPLDLAISAESESRQALDILADLRKDEDITPALLIEINDVEAWCHYGFYFAEKIRGGVALHRFRTRGAKTDRDKAIQHLTRALGHWTKLTEAMEKFNVPEFPYQFDQEFSWRKHIPDVEKDIALARR